MVEDSLASTPVAERLALELFIPDLLRRGWRGQRSENSTIQPRGGAIFERY